MRLERSKATRARPTNLYSVQKQLDKTLTGYNIRARRRVERGRREGRNMGTTGAKVLISGASFAGLSTAHWLRRLGYDVTVVEIARGLRVGGTAVDIKGQTVDVVRRMGLLESIREDRLGLRRLEIKNADDVTERVLVMREDGEPPPEDELEIERTALLNMLFDTVKDDVEVVFDDSITALRETDDGVAATFARGAGRSFDLVFGCDGVHSGVRRLWFGEERQFSRFLGRYTSVTIVDELLIEPGTAQIFNVPGKVVMLNAYKDKTDVIFGFISDVEIPYDHRDEAQQRRIIREHFADVGWRTPELLRLVERAASFYFDKLCQIRMPSWSRGRVALVGDAGYCPSPAAGMGGSMALDGAAALADAMRAHAGDHASAFRTYEERLRPFVEEVQAEAEKTARETLIPATEEEIRARNAETGSSF
jgi:2-polyprenyl-6-methoxyphenol hydroxylase-like FAD-dependent oxidoreductase